MAKDDERGELGRLRALEEHAVAYMFGDHSAEQAKWWDPEGDVRWDVYRRGAKVASGLPKEKAVAMAEELHAGEQVTT